MRRLLVVGVVMALLPLAGCLPDNPWWPNGIPVHPQFAGGSDQPSVDAQGQALIHMSMCVVGLAYDDSVVIDAFDHVAAGSLEEWYDWLATDLPGRVVTTGDCWQSFYWPRTVYYYCGNGLRIYYGPQTPDAERAFRLYFLCNSNGDAFAPPDPHL